MHGTYDETIVEVSYEYVWWLEHPHEHVTVYIFWNTYATMWSNPAYNYNESIFLYGPSRLRLCAVEVHEGEYEHANSEDFFLRSEI